MKNMKKKTILYYEPVGQYHKSNQHVIRDLEEERE